MLVVDTSAVLAALADAAHPANAVLGADGDLHAPHLIDVEVLHVLHRLVARKALTAAEAEALRADFDDLNVVRYPHQPLGARMWELRQNVTAYDAAFIALSEALGAPLLTADRKLARAPGHRATIRLVRSSGS